ncbi:glycosyltransferase family 2 protein [Prevotella sp. 10(H)]|uniref:glycosyltransferase family 2 protein n=1 Tax=Prevotella sp. 10(H) TaxID=1158294 RepID=UPI0004A6F00D|nr:glycosyltransferase family 2 protein [Prevotella sp. 10(H)]
MMPEISIIIPIYNKEKSLKKCINSIVSQTFEKWELIAVNDCSPDNSYKILSACEKKDNRIKVINHSVNRGAINARFTGLENARGKYIVFVDADDWIPENALELLYDKIEKEDADIVIGGMVKVIDSHKIIKTKPRNTAIGENRTESITMPELFDKYYINFFGVNLLPSYMCGKIYRKHTLDKSPVKPTSYPMFEDMIFNLMLHPYLTKISFVTETVYYYRYGV